METTDWINLASAVGTVGATIVALWLAISDRRQRIDCVFMWESATNDKPTLILNNIGNRTVIVEKVRLLFHKQEICSIDLLRSSRYSNHAIISPQKESRIVIDVDSVKFNATGKPVKNPDTIYKLTAIVETTGKKKYKSSYKYCYNDILGLCFVAGFNDE